ncbi:MAG: hypothetical protein AUK47_14070 [Deltaproteobacteria bacterium CG2_30_63_29]|nr:MAG: hypothetical protein AUK47_14070 [Deltaproteobacteria bacterium CG2_30_63_29]PJB49147.1 MAG: hypothetical protein CO108_00840 [Deltaproteobacteria bacterium CG_4_9_14_3_um_filter_63_12]
MAAIPLLPTPSTRALAQARTFDDATALLEVLLERVKWQVQRAMRRFPERLFVDRRGYTDDSLGKAEIRRILGHGPDERAAEWLGEQGVADAKTIEAMLSRIEETIQLRLQDVARSDFRALLGTEVARNEPPRVPARDQTWPTEELRAHFALSDLELDLLLAAAAPRLSEHHARLYTFAWADFTTKQPTASFLADLVSEDEAAHRRALECLQPHGPLRHHRLLVGHGHERWAPSTPLLHTPLSVPQRILDYLQTGTLTSPLPHTTWWPPNREPMVPLEPEVQRRLRQLLSAPRARLAVEGLRGVGRCSAVRIVAAELGRGVVEVEAGSVPASDETTAELLREPLLRDAVLVLRLDGVSDLSQNPLVQTLLRDDEYPGRVVFLEHLPQQVGDWPVVALPVPRQESAQAHWSAALAGVLDETQRARVSQDLSGGYALTPAGMRTCIKDVCQRQNATKASRKAMDTRDLVDAAQRVLDREISTLATPYRIDATLDDVVLPDTVRECVDDVLIDARHRRRIFGEWGMGRLNPGGRGLSVLFAGPPGTGKTLVAGVLANTLNRALYRVDLSQVVDKYIGETEKNLGRVFDEAERAQAVLLFDEADALFATRTAVKSSNDRYANLEVNYLLQRLEAFDGMSILTTNFASSIDDAFQRRIRHIIEFPMPDADGRAALWQTLLPESAPLAQDLDFEMLGAAFELSGGHIRNAIFRAALRAADGDRAIAHRDLFKAGLRECKELGILVPDRLAEEFQSRRR